MSQKPLNKAQKQAVEYLDGPLLIVAGAGTGKTSVITEKIRYLIEEKKVHPGNILALTFTEKAATEMQERVESMMDFGVYDTHISTFHAFCQEVLEEFGLHIGLPNHFKLMTDTDAWLLLREHIYDFDLDYYRPLGNPTRHIHEMLKHFSKCKDELIAPAQYLEYAEGIKLDGDDVETEENRPAGRSADGLKVQYTEIANAYHTYNQLLLDKGALDFGDLIFYTIKLLKERPSVRKKLQERFKYILVDEFQDVNYAQYVLTQFLSESSQLTVVGDDDQSIYAFRGASVSNILRFQEDFQNAKNIVLNENYRSGQEILDIAYQSIRNNNPDRLEVKLNINKKLEAKTEGLRGYVHQHILGTIDDEVKFVVQEIIRHKKQNPDSVWDDFAILVRANNHAEPFLRGLQNAGIPYEFLAAVGLFKQSIVMDAINFFKVLDYHHDSPAMYRVLRMPCLNFTEEDMQKVTSNAKRKTISYYEVLKRAAEFEISLEGIEIANKILGLIDECVQKARIEKPSKVLHHFFEGSGCSKYLVQKESEGDDTVIHDVYQLQQFFEFLARFEETTPDAHLKGFLEQYASILESGDEGKLYQPTDTPDSVNIMTIHASKGLEFKYVFIVNMVEDRFPSRRRSDPLELPSDLVKENLPEGDYHIEEERRLLYVAMTRAKEHLYLLSAKNYGGVREKKLSRFLVELGFTDAKSVDTAQAGKNCHPEEQSDGGSSRQKAAEMVRSFAIAQDDSQKREKTKKPYQLPKTYSFSQIQTYEACPYKYKLSHIIKIPTKSTASFSFGTSMHSTLQKFYEKVQELNSLKQTNLFEMLEENQTRKSKTVSEGIKVPSLSELFEIYDESFIRDWYRDKNQKEEYYKKGKDILKKFYSSHENKWEIPVKLESSFKIQVAGHTLKGRIDRIDKLFDNTLEIIDYKTGQSKEKLTAEDKQQLLIYQIVAENVPLYRNLGKVSKLTFYYLNDDTKISFVGTDKDLEKLRDKIQTSIENIQAENFTATPSAPICANCDFRDICEYRML